MMDIQTAGKISVGNSVINLNGDILPPIESKMLNEAIDVLMWELIGPESEGY